MSSKIIVLAALAMLAVAVVQVDASCVVSAVGANKVAFIQTPTAGNVSVVTTEFTWAELVGDVTAASGMPNCITASSAAAITNCDLKVHVYVSAAAGGAYDGSKTFNPSSTVCAVATDKVTCTSTLTTTVNTVPATNGHIVAVLEFNGSTGSVLSKGFYKFGSVLTTTANACGNSNDAKGDISASTLLAQAQGTPSISMDSNNYLIAGVTPADKIAFAFGNTVSVAFGNSAVVDIYLPGWTQTTACTPGDLSQISMSGTSSDFSVTPASGSEGLKIRLKTGASGNTAAAASLKFQTACGLQPATAGSHTGYWVEVGSNALFSAIQATKTFSYVIHTNNGMKVDINYSNADGIPVAVLSNAGNALTTNTGYFTYKVTADVAVASANKFNTISITRGTATHTAFNSSVCTCTKKKLGTVETCGYTLLSGDVAAGLVVFRSTAAGGALTANDLLVFKCPNMSFATTTDATDNYSIIIMRDAAAATAGSAVGLIWASSGQARVRQPGQTVGTVSSTLSVVDKAGTAFTLGAAPANYWTNVNADQYLKIAFAGLGTKVDPGTASVITVTMPAAGAWAFDTTNTKDNTTLKVAGTDVTAKYTIACASATECKFTPKDAADGGITLTDEVEILFGKVTRSGAVVANELVTVSMVGNISGNQFYLPKSNSMGAKGSVMKASIAGKTLTGSVSGFENAVTASDSKTSTVTPDTTYTFTTTPNDCTGSLPAGKAITSTQTTTVATLTMKSDATIADAAAAKLAVLDFSCKLANVPNTFATGKTVAVTRHANESGTFDLSEDKGSSAASASSTVGVVLGAVFGVVGLAQLTL